MCTCGHSEKDHAPCGKCLVEGCECEVLTLLLPPRSSIAERLPRRSAV
jgi:hypothetical protein